MESPDVVCRNLSMLELTMTGYVFAAGACNFVLSEELNNRLFTFR
jgi:hypothetical protein